MKRKIFLLFIFCCSLNFSKLPEETITRTVRKCNDITVYECENKCSEFCHVEQGHNVCDRKCSEDCRPKIKQECEEEDVTRKTGFYETYVVDKQIKEYAKNRSDEIKKKEPTFGDKFRAFFTGKSAEEVRNARAEELKKEIENVARQDARENGTDIRENPSIYDETTNSIVNNKDIESRKTTDENIKAINKSADSKVVRKYHRIDRDAVLYENNIAYDPYAKPITVSSEREITKEMKERGVPIYIHLKREENNNDEDRTPSYSYYTLKYDNNNADGGVVPNSRTQREGYYIKVDANYGNLTKNGYKFVAWNTKRDGSGTSYKENESIKMTNNLILFAKWEKVEAIEIAPEPPKEVENERYSITFIANEYSSIVGDNLFYITKGNSISKIANIEFDKGYTLKGFKDNNGIFRTEEEVKNLIPNSNISFVVVTQKDANAKIIIPMIELTPAIIKDEIAKPVVIYNQIEVYVGDDVSVDDVVSSYNENFDGYIKLWIIKPDTSRVGKTSGTFKIFDSKTDTVWTDFDEVNTITVIEKPRLTYKTERIKHINNEISIYDLIEPTLDDRYVVSIINNIDTNTIGTKAVNLRVIDTKTGREFNDYETDITLFENLKELNYIIDANIYINDVISLDDIINSSDIPAEYTISIITTPDSSTLGDDKVFTIRIENKQSGSSWDVERNIDVISEPSISGNLWIYQNDKNPDEKGIKFIDKIHIDLNDRYENRYGLVFVSSGKVDIIGHTNFTYKVIDKKKNREFLKTISVEVIEENINIKLNNNAEFYVGHDVQADEIVIIENENNYEISIDNREELNISKLTPGDATAKVLVISKISSKQWIYNVPIKYIDRYINLGELNWEKGEKLSLKDIRKHKEIGENYSLTLLSGILKTDELGSYDIEIKIMDNNLIYYIAQLRINIVENKTIEDLKKIDETTKINIISNISNISNNAIRKILYKKSKSTDLWINQTTNVYKYTTNSKSNVLGLIIGVDNFDNNKLYGAYFSYERLNHNLSSLSKQNLFSLGTYFTAKKNIFNNRAIMYLNILNQYTLNTAKLNFKNIHNNYEKYNMQGHNIINNIVLGWSQELKEGSFASFSLGNTLIYSFNNRVKSIDKSISIDNNITNEIYVEFMENKKINNFNIYGSLKLSCLLNKTVYRYNNISWINNINRFNVYFNLGSEYTIKQNHKIGLEFNVKNKDEIHKLNSGIKAKYEYKW